MRERAPGRRRFLVAAITLAGAASGVFGLPALRLSRAWAQGGAELESGTLAAMVRIARRLFPHDAISDTAYAEVLDEVLESRADDASWDATFRTTEAALDAQQDAAFIELDETGQIASMRAIEDTDAFVAILAAVRSAFYNHPAVWARLGYEGPSFAQGGYLNRGAGEIDWLPEGD